MFVRGAPSALDLEPARGESGTVGIRVLLDKTDFRTILTDREKYEREKDRGGSFGEGLRLNFRHTFLSEKFSIDTVGPPKILKHSQSETEIGFLVPFSRLSAPLPGVRRGDEPVLS
jgi:hypothetical protein